MYVYVFTYMYIFKCIFYMEESSYFLEITPHHLMLCGALTMQLSLTVSSLRSPRSLRTPSGGQEHRINLTQRVELISEHPGSRSWWSNCDLKVSFGSAVSNNLSCWCDKHSGISTDTANSRIICWYCETSIVITLSLI